MSSELLQSSHKSKLIPGFIPPCFYLFSTLSFLYINGPDRGSGSTAHPSPVTSSIFLELRDSLATELLAAFKLKSKVCLFDASVCYCRLQDCAPTGLTQSSRAFLVSWHTKYGWPCLLIAQREQARSSNLDRDAYYHVNVFFAFLISYRQLCWQKFKFGQKSRPYSLQFITVTQIYITWVSW